MDPKFGAQKGNKLGSQLGPMSITIASSPLIGLAKWAPFIALNFCCLGSLVYMHTHARTRRPQAIGSDRHVHRSNVNTAVGKLVLWLFIVIISSLFTNFFVKPAMTVF